MALTIRKTYIAELGASWTFVYNDTLGREHCAASRKQDICLLSESSMGGYVGTFLCRLCFIVLIPFSGSGVLDK